MPVPFETLDFCLALIRFRVVSVFGGFIPTGWLPASHLRESVQSVVKFPSLAPLCGLCGLGVRKSPPTPSF